MSLPTANINDFFFEGIYKDIWRGMIPEGLTQAEVAFILETGNLEKGNRVLDIMCGYGRHALGLARNGIAVTAVDNLGEYIDEIKHIATSEGLPVQTVLSGALQAPLEGCFDGVICMGNSFGFFDRRDATALLKKLGKHLKPGGFLLINSWMIAEIAIRYFKEREWHQVNNYKYLLENKFLFHPNRIESEQTIIGEDGYSETIKGVDYIFSLDELEDMFQEAGFKTRECYHTPRKKQFSLGDGRIYIIAEKMGAES
ncbi:MAG: class I SAM-dependent methyltransferase [Flavisolibacter sp.]